MSRIDDLVAELCPKGVRYCTVSEVTQGVTARPKIKREDYLAEGAYPVIDQGQTYVAAYTNDSDSVLPESSYVLFGEHTRAVKFVDFAFAQGADGLKVLRPTEDVLPRFLYFAIANLDVPSRGYNRHWPVLKSLTIPVPPLEVQSSVVEVLDSFVQLQAELEAELNARRSQYAHYRDALLQFANGSVEWATMGEVGEFVRGKRFTKADLVDEGVACIHFGEIYTRYGAHADRVFSNVRSDLAPKLRFAKTGDLVIAGVGETVEDICKAVAWLGPGEVAVHDDCFYFRHNLHPKFVAYYFQTAAFHAEKEKFVARAKVKRISGESLAKLRIPVPSIEEQARIVTILDAFDSLVNDIAIGLPAEIVARRKQYEYYLDKVLTFDEAV